MGTNLLEKIHKLSKSISGIAIDSRLVKENEVFFALKGKNYDGNDYIDYVLKKNVLLVVTDEARRLQINSEKILYVSNIRQALSSVVRMFYHKQPQNVIGITGTNGKSSVASYIAQICFLLGKQAASVGTLGLEIFGIDPVSVFPAVELTTPDYLTLKKIMHSLAECNISYFAFEASSHGLAQNRLNNIKVQIACFTSFSQDHLDYHGNREAYLLVKLRLFVDHLLPGGLAILDSDIPEIEFIKDYLNKNNIQFVIVGVSGDLQILKVTSSLEGQNVYFSFNNKEYIFYTPMIGNFQVRNLLMASLACYRMGFDFDKIVGVLQNIKSIKGRMERVTDLVEFRGYIFVDYAHTPDSLEKVLQELKSIKPAGGVLKVVFGCGGNRDKLKRKIMGEIAGQMADEIIITDDNPRDENPAIIRKEIISGVENFSKKYIEIGDRKEAITHAISNLSINDILLVAGRGHENYQIIRSNKILFNDAEVVRRVIAGD